MTYEEAVITSNELKKHLNGAFSVSQKEQIQKLYSAVLRKSLKVTSCQRCYHDALIEVILYLRKEGRMKEECAYSLRAGFIIHCPTFRGGKIYTNDNLTNDVARDYLAAFPGQRSMFSRIQEEKVVEASAQPVTEEPKTIEVKVKKHKSKKK